MTNSNTHPIVMPAIELLSEFEGGTPQTTPQPTPTAPVPPTAVPPQPPTPVQGRVFTEAEIKAAREQEKEKLYGQLDSFKQEAKLAKERADAHSAELERLRQQMKEAELSKLPEDQRAAARIDDLQQTLMAREADFREQLAQRDREQMQFRLELYRKERINQLVTEGVGIMDHLIGGSTIEDIDKSIEVAKAEYALWQQRFEQQFMQKHAAALQAAQHQQAVHLQHQQPTPDQVAASFAPTAQPQAQPVAGPTPTAPAPVPSSGTPGGAMDFSAIQQLTSPDAIRSGDYAKHRSEIIARLRQGVPVGAVQLPMRPFPGAQPQVAAPVPLYTTTAPGPHMPHAPAPGGVMQPQGLPTPQVQNPNIPQQAGMGMPSVPQGGYPQPGYPQAAPAPVYPQGYPQAQPAPAGYAQPPVAYQPAPAPAAPAQGDVNAMRAQAAQAAAAALGSPQAAASRAATVGGTPPVHGEYKLPQGNPNAPTAQALGQGAHPMVRNT